MRPGCPGLQCAAARRGREAPALRSARGPRGPARRPGPDCAPASPRDPGCRTGLGSDAGPGTSHQARGTSIESPEGRKSADCPERSARLRPLPEKCPRFRAPRPPWLLRGEHRRRGPSVGAEPRRGGTGAGGGRVRLAHAARLPPCAVWAPEPSACRAALWPSLLFLGHRVRDYGESCTPETEREPSSQALPAQ